METDYTKRELDAKFDGVHDSLKSQNVTLDKILDQATRTNGNVRQLQLWQASAEGWIRGFGIAVACIIALVGVIYFSLKDSENQTQNLLEKHIQETMTQK